MTFIINFDIEYKRTVTAVLIDSRATIPAIATKIGTVIKTFCDWEINMIDDTVIPYKIENSNGNLVGYFTLRMNGMAAFLFQYQLRPSFVPFNTQISQLINTFVQTNGWQKDVLN